MCKECKNNSHFLLNTSCPLKHKQMEWHIIPCRGQNFALLLLPTYYPILYCKIQKVKVDVFPFGYTFSVLAFRRSKHGQSLVLSLECTTEQTSNRKLQLACTLLCLDYTVVEISTAAKSKLFWKPWENTPAFCYDFVTCCFFKTK